VVEQEEDLEGQFDMLQCTSMELKKHMLFVGFLGLFP